MRALFLGLLLSPAAAAPAGTGAPMDLVQEYNDAKARRDRAAAELERQSRKLSDAAADAVARAEAGRAVEAAQKSLQAAQAGFDTVVRKMKPGDAIWVEETKVGQAGPGAAMEERYGTRIPAVGDGVVVDPSQAAAAAAQAVLGDTVRVLRGPPPGGSARPPNAVPTVGYGRPPGFDNDKRDYNPGAFMGPGAPHVRDPRKPRPAPEPEAWPQDPAPPPPPEEGVPFNGPLPEQVARVGFVVFPQNETFPTLLRFEAKRPGAGSLKVLAAVASAVGRGDLAGAWKSAEFLAKRHPDDPGVRRLAAILLLRLGRLAEADAHISAALKLDPMNAEAWTVLAWLRLRQGRRAEAGEAARWALRIDPASAAAAAALKASGVAPLPAAGAVQPPPVSPQSPFARASSAAAPPEPPPGPSRWGALVLAVAGVSGAALAFALKGLVFRRKV